MKLATFRAAGGAPAVGAVIGDEIVDLSAHFPSMLALIDGGEAALALAASAAAAARSRRKLAEVALLSPVPEPRQIRDFNNFEQHIRDAPWGVAKLRARLAGLPEPERGKAPAVGEVTFKQPIFYLSNRFNVVGHDAEVHWPRYSEWFDFELEFGVFLGRKGKDIPKARAAEHIFGYAVFNDFSARDRQVREMEGWLGPTKGKSFDTGNAIGPWIVTRDEIPDPQALAVSLRVNGEVWAQNSTAGMLHSFEDMISFVSQDETLHPGEFFGSGTIGGGCGLECDRWLKDGDVVEAEVEKIGVLRNRVVRRSR
jgi:2-keto-4-pentenoate hydratase/2-oxohepta-3-ene-1,7-dioic acid hydratase in catechol pathway